MRNYPKDIEKAYKTIFEEVKEIVPHFDFQNFNANLEIKKSSYEDGLDERILTISFDIDSVHYDFSSFYDFQRKDEKPKTELKIVHSFYKIINKFLADQNSEKRLYFAEKRGVFNTDENEFGLILLNEEKRKLWQYRAEYNIGGKQRVEYFDLEDYFLSEENHDNTFNTQNISKIIEEYKNIGLFSHLSKEEFELGIVRVKQNQIGAYSDILGCFPKQIVFFDWESGNLENPYEELTKEFGEASRGYFTPTNIKDFFESSWDNEQKTTYYSFDFGGVTYEEDLEIMSDWLDTLFMELIERALNENNIDGKIYTCIDDGQAAGYIFLTKAQYKYLNKNQPEIFTPSYDE